MYTRIPLPTLEHFGNGHGQRTQQKRKPATMSVVIGIVCKNGIALASESQLTDNSVKFTDKAKIHSVDFKNGTALVGEAGSETISSAALRKFREMAIKTRLSGRDTAWKTAKAALHAELLEIKSSNGYTEDGYTREIFSEFGYCEWLVCSPFKGLVQLDYIHSSPLTCRPITQRYMAAGVGSDVASYLMRRMVRQDMDVIDAAALAVYVIEQVCSSVDKCSGPVQVSVASPFSVMQYSQGEILEISERLKEADAMVRESLNDAVDSILKSNVAEFKKGIAALVQHIIKQPKAIGSTIGELAKQIEKRPKITASRASLKEERAKRPLP